MNRQDGLAARIYRLLLVLYPAAFRERFGDEIVQLFADQMHDVRRDDSSMATTRTWLRALRDLTSTAASEHARRNRTVAHSLAAPTVSTRLLGLTGVVGGVVLVAAFLPSLPWTRELFQLRLVLFNVGAIAIAVAVHRCQARIAPRLSLAAAGAVVAANSWYLAMVIVGIDRPQPPLADPEFRLIGFWAGVAMWLADAAFGIVAWRLRAVTRAGAIALAVGSLLAFTGMDRLELVQGEWGWLVGPAALVGIALSGLGWMVLGLDIALRRRRPPAVLPPAGRIRPV